jgi:acyl-ACP thioesterase
MNAAQMIPGELTKNIALHAILWLNAAKAKTMILNSVSHAKKVRPGEKISTALLATQKRSAAKMTSGPSINDVNAIQTIIAAKVTSGPSI